jgi:hypothetical protein
MKYIDREDMLNRWNAHREILSNEGYTNIQAITVPDAGHGLNGEYIEEKIQFFKNNM